MTLHAHIESPLFQLGQLVATPHALDALAQHGITPLDLLRCHAAGDWGDVSQDDAMANQTALQSSARVLSAYHIGNDAKVWIITEADRSATTILLPSDN